MKPPKEPQAILDHYLLSQQFSSARDIHRLLGIRQPYPFWIKAKITHAEPLSDYMKVGNDIYLSPIWALNAVAGGGSTLAAKVQALYCKMLADVVFKDRCPIEVIDTGIKVSQADAFLSRELDPERHQGKTQ